VQPEIPHQLYEEAILRELELRAPAFEGLGAPISLYFGGGSPGLWAPRHLGRIFQEVKQRFGQPREITIECNPEDLSLSRLQALRAQGINRLSLGVQSFQSKILQALGRRPEPELALRAIEDLKQSGFEDFSLDLIFGLAGESLAEALGDLEQACASGAPHLSLYQLTLAAGTPFGARAARGEQLLSPEELQAEIFLALRARLAELGRPAYEISNAACPGFEAVHNSLYWTGCSYLGLGAGAHGFLASEALRWENLGSSRLYLKQALSGTFPEARRERLSVDELALERLMTGLRLSRGLKMDGALKQRFGVGIKRLIQEGRMEQIGEYCRATEREAPILDKLILELL